MTSKYANKQFWLDVLDRAIPTATQNGATGRTAIVK